MAEIDRAVVRRALKKRANNEKLTRDEQRHLRRFERDREEEQRWAYYRTIPKKHWIEMSGRSAKVLLDQARTHDAPLLGKTVSLPALAKWLHDFLGKNKTKLAGFDSDDPLLAGVSSPALEEYRRESAKIAKLKRLALEGQTIDREVAHGAFSLIASRYREAAHQLQRQAGVIAYEILEEAIDDATREVARLFDSICDDGDGDDSADKPASDTS